MKKKTTGFLCLAGALLAFSFLLGAGAAGGASRVCVVVDAGHGGADGGATSVSGIKESAINLQIAKRLEPMLAFLGADVVMTRTDDSHLGGSKFNKAADIKSRVALAEDPDCDALISIHQNFFTDAKYGGAQVFYNGNEKSAALAELTQKNLALALDPDNSRKAKYAGNNVYLMKHTDCLGILVECGFLSNYEDDARLQTADYQKKTAMAVAASLFRFQEGQ